MRKIVVNEFVSLDGVMEAPEKWTFQYYNDEVQKVIADGFSPAAFSGQTGPDADIMNSQRKYVVSTTLQKADWNNSTLIKGNIAEEIAKLKQQPGKDIAISGAGTLVRSLMQLDLVDEYSLLVYPVVLGSGMRLFEEGTKATLKLLDAKPLSSGVVYLSYEAERKQ